MTKSHLWEDRDIKPLYPHIRKNSFYSKEKKGVNKTRFDVLNPLVRAKSSSSVSRTATNNRLCFLLQSIGHLCHNKGRKIPHYFINMPPLRKIETLGYFQHSVLHFIWESTYKTYRGLVHNFTPKSIGGTIPHEMQLRGNAVTKERTLIVSEKRLVRRGNREHAQNPATILQKS